MKKVYVVTTGNYSDFSIYAIFERKADAEAIAKVVEDSNGVDEWDLSTARTALPTWLVWFDKEGKVNGPSQNPCTEINIRKIQDGGLQVGCRAATAERALKIACDMRAKFLAKKAGL